MTSPSKTEARPGSDTPEARRPEAALSELVAGNRRFASGQPLYGHDVTAAAAYASADQQPFAAVIGCLDSRVPVEAIFDQTFGSICVIRTGAHVLDRSVRGSIEYAVTALHVPLVVVLGHERCGAVAATIQALRTGQRPKSCVGYLIDQIAPAVAEVGPDNPQAQPLSVRRHVNRTVAALRTEDWLAGAIAAGEADVVGGVYDLSTSKVQMLWESRP